MAIATNVQNKSRRRGNPPTIYETCERLNMTNKKQPGETNIYDGDGNRRAKQTQTQKSKHLRNLWAPEHDKKQNREKNKIYDGHGHRRSKQIQTTQKSTKHVRNL